MANGAGDCQFCNQPLNRHEQIYGIGGALYCVVTMTETQAAQTLHLMRDQHIIAVGNDG